MVKNVGSCLGDDFKGVSRITDRTQLCALGGQVVVLGHQHCVLRRCNRPSRHGPSEIGHHAATASHVFLGTSTVIDLSQRRLEERDECDHIWSLKAWGRGADAATVDLGRSSWVAGPSRLSRNERPNGHETMRTPSLTSGDLLVGKSDTLTTPLERLRGPSSRYHPANRHLIRNRSEIERLRERQDHLMRSTITNRSLETHFQPIVDLRTGRAVGVEALARFAQQPIRPPDVWFAEAASLGLGVELELTALDLALGQLDGLPPSLYLSLNASVETIMCGRFQTALADTPAERIVLELTEHTPIVDYGEFEQCIRNLRSQGVRLAVDDAGAGFSSFRHILDLQPDVIKLDIGLIHGIDTDPARQSLGRALLTFALETSGTTIVAEGIETEGELETLRALGCPSGQGFLLGRPSRLPSASLRLPTPQTE
jgi:EAL domain-containing protein (putative c-di-GMP-specific phosphodiesterase class I)